MFTVQPRNRPLIVALLITNIIVACERPNSSSPADDPNQDGGAQSSELSGKAGSAILRVERS